MEYSAQNLEYAVSVFYNGDQSERAKAHAWLTIAQRVPEAWNFVWELLQPIKGTEIQFYAATTLHTKILRCWNEVPPESYEELKNKLLQAIFTYSKGPKIVTNRLCISLAAFILQQGTVNLATTLHPLSTLENSTLIIEVLTVIPEEYNSMTMGSALRTKNRIALQQACPAVLEDMLRCLETVYNYTTECPPEQVVQSWVTAATCACSWLTLGGEDAADHQTGSLPERMPLCRAMLAIVHLLYTWHPAVSDTPLDACEACLSSVRAAASSSSAAQYHNSALQLLTDLAAIATPIMTRDNVPNSINEELLAAVITCLVSLCENHATTLVKAAQSAEGSDAANGARQLIELMVAAQAAPGHYPLHETRSNLTFGFWYTLQDEILQLRDKTQEIHPIWRQLFSRLLETLVTKSAAPADVSLSKDDQELLRCYRQDISDTVMYCYAVLGQWCWATVEAAFTAATTDSGREAALHVFAALADVAPSQRSPNPLVALLHHALNVAHTSTNKRMVNTALECFGSYASWMSSVREGLELGPACVRAAGAALQRCPPAASLALRKLASDCSGPVAALAPDIVQAAQTFQIDSPRSDGWVRRQLVSAAGAALAASELETAGPLLQPLAEMLRDELKAHSCDTSRALLSAEVCAFLLGSLSGSRPLAAALFQVLAPVLPAYASNQPLVEPLFHILKQTVSSLIDELPPVVSDIAQLIVAGFNTYPCPSGLDVVKLVVLALGSEWSGARELLHMSISASMRTLAPDPAARPELTEAMYFLLQAIIKKKPQFLDWLDDILPDLMDLACVCLRVPDMCTVRPPASFLSALVAQCPQRLQDRAPTVTVAAMACIGIRPNQIEPMADLLLTMNRTVWQDADLSSWLRPALATPGFPTIHATDAHKQKFIQSVVKEKKNKRRIIEAVQEFSLVCRGLVDTEYARQTIAAKQLVA